MKMLPLVLVAAAAAAAPPTQTQQVACDKTHSCPTDTTCCATVQRSWGCCGTANGTCCSDMQHCCPSAFPVCAAGKCKKTVANAGLSASVPWLSTLGSWVAQEDFSHGGETLRVQLFSPVATAGAVERAPLTLCLHSSGSLGTDNQLQLRASEPCYIWAGLPQREPTFVLAPQLAAGRWADHADTVAALLRHYVERLGVDVDVNRLYATGHSNGAAGVWQLLNNDPGLIAAASASSSDLSAGEFDASVLARTPQFVVASAADSTVVPARTQAMVDAMRAAGASEEHVQWLLLDGEDAPGHGQVPTYVRSTLPDRFLSFFYNQGGNEGNKVMY